MLQINSGKLFSNGVGRTNHLRGVLYSNLELCYGRDIATAAGVLRETDRQRGSRAIVFEIEERIEKREPEFLISHTLAPYALDFSAVATFGLRAIVSPDAQLVDALLSSEPGLASYDPPRRFVQRYFEPRIPAKESEIKPFAGFVDQLIALDRKTFLAAMRSIRTFVSGLHRMRDDLGLAYTLFVSAVESLAQDFDAHSTRWQDVDERKRKPVDAALKRASATTQQRVRDAIVSAEHASLARRYRAFVLDHVSPDYFRSPELSPGNAAARNDLDEALRQAYRLRSRHIHNLRELPDAIRLALNTQEIVEVERRPTLTFQGLVRLTHHVVAEFVRRGRTVDFEPYDYTLEIPSVATFEWAPEIWVGTPLKFGKEARRRLEGHLEQLVPVLCRTKDRTVSDLRPIFGDILRLAKAGSPMVRTRLLTLYALFAALLAKPDRSPELDALLEKHWEEIRRPSSEALVSRTLFGTLEDWPLETHDAALSRYFEARSTASGIKAPRLLDAAMCVALAERYRKAGSEAEAKRWLAKGVEACPGHAGLLHLERDFVPARTIRWQKALIPGIARRRARSAKS